MVLPAQKTDTLPAVQVKTSTIVQNAASPRPIQQIDKKYLETLNSVSVADATKFFSGVLLKDYGGLGGLKTISVRSLGTGYTGVMYDGVLLSDVQAGQIDLGKISTANIESITLYNGQPLSLLMPAKAFATGAVLNLETNKNFDTSAKSKWSGIAMLKAGSFNFFNPSVSVQYKSKNFTQTLSTEWQSIKGNYSYKAYELDGSIKKRNNSDLQSLRVEYDAGYRWNDNNHIQFKVYHYNSNRGLPGAVALYTIGGKERLSDKNSFVQSIYKKNISIKSKLMLLAKYAHQYNFYKDPDQRYGPQGLTNRFTQQEYYFSAGYSYKITKVASVAYSADYIINNLKGSGQFATPFAQPTRKTTYNNILLDAKWHRLHIQANALHTFQTEKVENGPVSKNLSRLNPSFSIAVQPFIKDDVHLRFFYKNIFKTPTFNDLYYAYVGNTNLKPEQAAQYNIGITWKGDGLANKLSVQASADFYITDVQDKIVAVPNQNLFRWTMLNYGKVFSKGIDIALEANATLDNEATIAAKIIYGYQDAKEADKSSAFYGLQIPYTPLHSGNVQLRSTFKRITIAANAILSSYRYKLGNQIPDNLVKEWATIDLYASYNLKTGLHKTKIFAELNNVLNRQYDIIKFYPMPRFNYRVGITSNF